MEMIVEFAPGEDIKEIPFVVIDDNITEAFEVVSFDITSRMPRVNDGKPLFNVVFIRDDDSKLYRRLWAQYSCDVYVVLSCLNRINLSSN